MSPPTYKRKYDSKDHDDYKVRDYYKKMGGYATRRWGGNGTKKRKGGKQDKKRRGGKTKRRRMKM